MQVLTNRQQEILKTIVELYLQGYGQISSLMLKSLNIFDISSATIRHELAELTKKGFLKKSHYAAGRIPTLAAFQIYINQLLDTDYIPSNAPSTGESFILMPDISLTITDVFVNILDYLASISSNTYFILYNNLTLLKNISTLNNQLLEMFSDKNIATLVFNKITKMLDNPISSIQLLKELYAQYAIKSIAIIPIQVPVSIPAQDIFMTYSLFKFHDTIGILGTVGKPTSDYLTTITRIFELSSILSAM